MNRQSDHRRNRTAIWPRLRWLLCYGLLSLLVAAPGSAHEVRPAALDLNQQADGQVAIVWKQPVLSGRKLKMRPILPDQCALPGATQQVVTGTAIVESWTTHCTLDRGTLTIEGLDRTLTDVFVRISRPDAGTSTHILRPARASLDLGNAEGSAVRDYLWIGAAHMLFGWDHLLFVLALVLLSSRRQILWVVTAFTLGHSVTLAITALGLFTLPGGPVELLIALSIFFLAVEIVRKRAGKTSITIERPWLIALLFGLLHGLGFAGALADIGLPKGEELWALLLFNLGVELGQILFVLAVLGLLAIVHRLRIVEERWIVMPATYLIGGLGAYYCLDRIIA